MSDIESIINDEIVEPTVWPFGTQDFFRLAYNPFQDKLPDPKAFVGYEKELREILRCIRTRTNVFVTGPIGAGKTAMLKSIHEILVKKAKDYRSCFVRVEKARFEKELAKEML